MRRLLLILCLLAASGGIISAQENARYTCPTLDVVGPSGILKPGETAKFTAKIVVHDGAELQFKYNWHVSYGKILSGQGTATIEVDRPPSSTIVAVVDIAGTPDDSHCPRSSSEIASWDAPAEAEKVTTIRGTQPLHVNSLTINGVTSTLSQNPSNHLYVFLGYKRDSSEDGVNKRESEIFDKLSDKLERARYSIVRVPGNVDVTEFWRIPPGAATPSCEECIADYCPNISVTGPAGVVRPRELFVFTGTVDGKTPKNVKYKWTVTGGKIVDGQGTLKLSADAEWHVGGANVTVTLNVLGLSEGCPDSASTAGGVTLHYPTILIDEFGRLPNYAIRKRLDKFFAQLANNPDNQGYIILYGTAREMAARERLIVIATNGLQFDRSRITIVRGGAHPDGTVYTRLYRVPPGADNPTP